MQACDNAQGLCPHQVLAHINGATTSQDGVSLVYPRPSRNVSLRLQGLQEKDSGSYRCSVNVQDKQGTSRGHSSKTLKLDVWGKKHTPSSTSPPTPPPREVRQVSPQWLSVQAGGGFNGETKGCVCRGWCV